MQTHHAPKSFCGIPLSHGLLWLLLISIGVASRWMWVDIPNFKPVGAIALFCGFYFHRRWIGITAATSIMLVSDIALGFYQWTVMITVYGSMILACLLGSAISRRLRESNSCTHRVATISGASIVMSLIFFLVTNAAVVLAGWYPLSLSGLASSYLAGLPFLKSTLMSDFFFSTGIFSIYFMMQPLNASNKVGRRLNAALEV